MGFRKHNLGRGLYNVFSDISEQDTQEREEKRIKEQIKALKDERNTHNQRIKTIDVQLEKLEEKLATLTPKNTPQKVSDDTPKENVLQNLNKDKFVNGDSNLAAVKSIEATKRNLGMLNNPLIIYGVSGTGKTHLAQELAEEMRSENNSVLHLSAMEFIDRLVLALSNQTEDDFRQEMVECDLLIIDDLQHFVGRFGSQDELCLILDERITNAKQVLFTANEHPKNMDWNNHHLVSRLLSGLNVKVELADTTMQIQMLSDRLEYADISLPQELLTEAVKNTHGNGWLIDGVAKQLIDMSLQGKEITHDTLEQNLQL